MTPADSPRSHRPADAPEDRAAHGPVADVSVRTGRAGDVAAVGDVQAAVWREAYGGVLAPAVVERFEPAAFAQVWQDALQSPPSPRHRLLVASAGPQVVGFVALGPSADPDATERDGELLALGVHPAHRRSGHGSRLLNAAVDTLRVGDFQRCRAWVLASDEPTRGFLAAAGLGPDGAFRDRVVDPDGSVTREVRLVADLAEP